MTEEDEPAGAQLGEGVERAGGDDRDDRVAAGHGVVGEEHGRTAVRRDLHGSGDHRLARQLAGHRALEQHGSRGRCARRVGGDARRIEAEFALAERAAAGAGATSTVRLGVLATLPQAWIDRLLADPAMASERFELVEGRERELVERLSRGRIDMALTIIRPDQHRFTAEPLLEEGYALALPATHPLANRAEIEAEELKIEIERLRGQQTKTTAQLNALLNRRPEAALAVPVARPGAADRALTRSSASRARAA